MALPALMLLILWAQASQVVDPTYDTTVTGKTHPKELPENRATSTLHKRDLEQRLPRSAPDALRYEPGVFVQQTAHGQGSTILRGLTGQQTLMLFDGIRMNNSTYRQGPNQYFFTIDARTIQAIEVQRGGGSTLWGSDALGGVINAFPIEPSWSEVSWLMQPKIFGRLASADSEFGGRSQLDIAGHLPNLGHWGWLLGVGGRYVDLLRGRPVLNPNGNTSIGPLPWVPRYAEYVSLVPFEQQPPLRTQLGTGFREITADSRMVLRTSPNQSWTLAAYLYQQYDVPRTDQCPPPTAPSTECLRYQQQFRHLVYLKWHDNLGPWAQSVRMTLSWQQQHERRHRNLTSASLNLYGLDQTYTYGLHLRLKTATWPWLNWLQGQFTYGLDTYIDSLVSQAYQTYIDTGRTKILSRGQYIDGAHYVYGGAYLDGTFEFLTHWQIHFGSRLSWIHAQAAADAPSGSLAIRRTWLPWIGHVGLEWQPMAPLYLFINYDHSYRAPNLDDMTARQQTGPGFQFENPNLEPERAHTLEMGIKWRSPWLMLDGWIYQTYLQNHIIKVSKSTEQCPSNTPQCATSWSRLQLGNSPGLAEIRGVEGSIKILLPASLTLRSTITYAWSQGPRVGTIGYDSPGVRLGEKIPLSRTPPLNGTAELIWNHERGITLGSALQWATAQTRLAIADYADGRIPKFGTPGFLVWHMRGSYRLNTQLLVAVVIENILDAPYRFHGSSINGAERGIMLQMEVAP